MTTAEKVALVQENAELLPAHNKEFAAIIILFHQQEGRLSPKQVMILNEFIRKIEKAQRKLEVS